jgi:UDP-N-acetylglucosamine diphosphorylase/glucosamine-1-phosphate N-acetyltransferase
MKVSFFDVPSTWRQLLPITYTRPCAELRVGILTLREKWTRRLGADQWFYQTEDYLQKKFPAGTTDLWINGAAVATDALAEQVKSLKPGEGLFHGENCIALNSSSFSLESIHDLRRIDAAEALIIERPYYLFLHAAAEIRSDLPLITAGRESAPITDPHTMVYGAENVFIEEGVTLQAAIIDATTGPVYLAKGVVVNPGAILRGSLAVGENTVISMGAKLRGDNSFGPNCKVGGEISNSAILGNSNKSHDGYLGNAVLGEWCNLGADSNCSNLKNNYSTIRIWNYEMNDFQTTGLKFCGLTMGDHSKCGINTMFNTGTVVGVSSNVYGSDFPEKFIPSFSWGSKGHWSTYDLDKAIQTAENVIGRRNLTLDSSEKSILKSIFERSQRYRHWE